MPRAAIATGLVDLVLNPRLVGSVDIPIVIVGSDLGIRRFTPTRTSTSTISKD